MLEKTLQSPLDSKEIKPVHPKGNQPWIFIARTAAEVEAPILWPSEAKSWLIGKDSNSGKDWRQKEKGAAEDEIVSIIDSIDMNLSKLWEIVKDSGAWCAAVRGLTKLLFHWATEQQGHLHFYLFNSSPSLSTYYVPGIILTLLSPGIELHKEADAHRG